MSNLTWLPRAVRSFTRQSSRYRSIASKQGLAVIHRQQCRYNSSNQTPDEASALQEQFLQQVREGGIKPASTSSPEAAAGAPVVEQEDASTDLDEGPRTTFPQMKGTIAYDIWKAITVRPFKYKDMSTVQQEVLQLLPDLAGPVKPDPDSRAAANPPRDLLVKARTGTGKTLAFLVPALQARLNELETIAKGVPGSVPKAIAGENRRNHSKNVAGALILSPTRELASQIATESEKLCSHLKDFDTSLLVGGASKNAQVKQFRRNRKDVIVATPGRLLDLLQDQPTRVAEALANVRTVIFDEADTLLDMGFKDEIDRILQYLPSKEHRQTFLFSATVSSEIRRIADKSLKSDHLFIDTVPHNEVNVHQHVPQFATVLPSAAAQVPTLARMIIHDALAHPDNSKVVIFLPTTKLTKLFSSMLIDLKPLLPHGRNTTIFEIHSQLTQQRRDRSSERFRSAKDGQNVLVTSDVSARGVDYPGVTRVIQVGIPSDADSYVHRTGRTGRAGKEGRADLLLLPFEANVIDTKLKKMPLQPLSASDIHDSTMALAQERDAKKIGQVLQDLDDTIMAEVVVNAEDEDVEDAFFSMIGYYLPHAGDLTNGRRQDLYHGLQSWTTGSMARDYPPHISPSMSAKMGLNKQRRPEKSRDDRFGGGKFGGRKDRFDDSKSFGNKDFSGKRYGNRRHERRDQPRQRWEGRGSKSASKRF